MKKRWIRNLLAAGLAGSMVVGSLAGCGSSTDSASTSNSKTSSDAATEDTSDKPDTWIADRTITVQAYVDDIGNTLPDDFSSTEVGKKIKELTASRWISNIPLATVTRRLWPPSWLQEPFRTLSFPIWITRPDRSSRFC